MPWLQEVLDITLKFEEAIWAKLPAKWLKRAIPADLISSSKKKSRGGYLLGAARNFRLTAAHNPLL